MKKSTYQSRMSTTEQKYKDWIRTLGDHQGGRIYFSDQTVKSMVLLERLVKLYAPTVIIELGTAHGLSTRLWIEQSDARIVCIDASFAALRGTAPVLPVDLDRLELIEKWVRSVHLQDLWSEDDKVLLYIDIHSDHQHVFDAIPDLPNGSVVLFDDVWRSDRSLKSKEEIDEFVQEEVIKDIDHTAPKAIWPLKYADYWKRGGFYGFSEIPQLCMWTAANKVTLHWEKGAKVVWFQWPKDRED